MGKQSEIVVLDPSGHTWQALPGSARRVASLSGLTIGILDNAAPNTGYLMDRVGELLVQRHAAAGTVTRRKDNFSRPAPARTLDDLAARCDAVVVGVGA